MSQEYQEYSDYEIDDAWARLDFQQIHLWLSDAYWSLGISRDKVERAAKNSSLVVGAYHGDRQIGYLRVVSDRTNFGYLCDVYVDESHRGKGLAKAMVRFTLAHPEHQGFRRWLRVTKDAHSVYADVGFTPPSPSGSLDALYS